VSHREVRISRASLNCSEMIPGGLTLEVEKLAWYDRDPHKPIGLELDKRRRKLAAVHHCTVYTPKKTAKADEAAERRRAKAAKRLKKGTVDEAGPSGSGRKRK